jgi:hypothetical protein
VSIFSSHFPYVETQVAYLWEGRQVLEAGESLVLNAQDPSWTIAATGYVFS